jgi:cyclase
MLKKRIIFTLLYNDGNFMLSRNFRLQNVGDLSWLQKNYNFSEVAFSIDELIILDVTRLEHDEARFCEHVKMIAKECFIPIVAGGGVKSVDQVLALLRSGADKIALNSIVADNPDIVNEIASVVGRQCVILSVDVKQVDNELVVFTHNGSQRENGNLSHWLEKINRLPIGELYLNSIDRDGTGQGYLMKLLDKLPDNWYNPVIIAGGAGNSRHLAEGLYDSRVNAVATAHLFNFVGDGLERAREELLANGIDLVQWDKKQTKKLRDCLVKS